MSGQTIGIAAAIAGAVFSVVYLVLAVVGVRSLRDIRDQLRRERR